MIEVDARGLKCPLPIIRAAQAARRAEPGELLTVLSTDPAAEPDFQAWCRMRGHELLAQEPLPEGGLRHHIRLVGMAY
jgi:tRNA 2-thiouridine synthesizing protein A